METLLAPIPLLTACFSIIATLGIAYLCWRAQSLHFLLRRFWLLVHGRKDIPDPRIQAFTQDQTSLYAFRLFSGTQVQSLSQAHALIAWSEAQQVPMATISACGDCFDLENHKVFTEKLPGKFYRGMLFLWVCALIICICLSIFIALVKPGLVTLKATDRWVVLNENRVERVFAWPFITPSLDRGDCKSRNPNRLQATEFSAEEIEIICNLLEIKEWPVYVAKNNKEQRQILLMQALIYAVCIGICIPGINKYDAARKLHQKLTQLKERDIEHTTA